MKVSRDILNYHTPGGRRFRDLPPLGRLAAVRSALAAERNRTIGDEQKRFLDALRRDHTPVRLMPGRYDAGQGRTITITHRADLDEAKVEPNYEVDPNAFAVELDRAELAWTGLIDQGAGEEAKVGLIRALDADERRVIRSASRFYPLDIISASSLLILSANLEAADRAAA